MPDTERPVFNQPLADRFLNMVAGLNKDELTEQRVKGLREIAGKNEVAIFDALYDRLANSLGRGNEDGMRQDLAVARFLGLDEERENDKLPDVRRELRELRQKYLPEPEPAGSVPPGTFDDTAVRVAAVPQRPPIENLQTVVQMREAGYAMAEINAHFEEQKRARAQVPPPEASRESVFSKLRTLYQQNYSYDDLQKAERELAGELAPAGQAQIEEIGRREAEREEGRRIPHLSHQLYDSNNPVDLSYASVNGKLEFLRQLFPSLLATRNAFEEFFQTRADYISGVRKNAERLDSMLFPLGAIINQEAGVTEDELEKLRMATNRYGRVDSSFNQHLISQTLSDEEELKRMFIDREQAREEFVEARDVLMKKRGDFFDELAQEAGIKKATWDGSSYQIEYEEKPAAADLPPAVGNDAEPAGAALASGSRLPDLYPVVGSRQYYRSWQEEFGQGERLAGGASGTVYRLSQHPEKVVKVFDEGSWEHCHLEEGILKKLQGLRSVVRLFGYRYQHDAPDNYLVKEFIDGELMWTRSAVADFPLKAGEPLNTALPLDEQRKVAAWLIGAMEGLAEVHARGVVISDFKYSDWLWDRQQQRFVFIDLANADDTKAAIYNRLRTEANDLNDALKAFFYATRFGKLIGMKVTRVKENDAVLEWGERYNGKSYREIAKFFGLQLSRLGAGDSLKTIARLMENWDETKPNTGGRAARQLAQAMRDYFKEVGLMETAIPAAAVMDEGLSGEIQRIAGETEITPERLEELHQRYLAERQAREGE